jgi:hypothetical protein
MLGIGKVIEVLLNLKHDAFLLLLGLPPIKIGNASTCLTEIRKTKREREGEGIHYGESCA